MRSTKMPRRLGPMLGEEGKPRQELFGKDEFHLCDKGYDLWASLLKSYLK